MLRLVMVELDGTMIVIDNVEIFSRKGEIITLIFSNNESEELHIEEAQFIQVTGLDNGKLYFQYGDEPDYIYRKEGE